MGFFFFGIIEGTVFKGTLSCFLGLNDKKVRKSKKARIKKGTYLSVNERM